MKYISRMVVPLVVSAVALIPFTATAQTTVKAVLGGDLQVLDPIASTSYPSRTFGYLVYDTLVGRDAEGNIQPQMLEGWDVSDDGLVYTFTLREGLTWHDGSPVRPEDCVASLFRWAERDPLGGSLIAATESLEAVDDRSFVLTLANPFGLVMDALAKESSNVPFMMPEALATTPSTEALTEVNGSGPFRFVPEEFVPGSHVVFERNADYLPRSEPASRYAGGKVVNIDRVELRWLPDSATQVSALMSGEIDYLQYVPFDLLPVLEASPDLEIFNPGSAASNMGLMRLNHLVAPFDDPDIRLALQAAIDPVEALVATGAPSDYVNAECVSYFKCGGVYESSSTGDTAINVGADRAREMLDAAGYNNEPVLMMAFAGDGGVAPATPVLIEQMKRAGFNVELQYLELNALFERRASRASVEDGGWSGFITFLAGTDVELPATNLYIANTCDPDYAGWSCDEETRSLLDQFTQESDLDARIELADQINARSHINLPSVLWGQFIYPTAWNGSMEGVIGEVPSPVFWSISKAQ